MATLLISGTDTGVGKTVVTSALAAYLTRYCSHRRFALLKPIQSGTGDREHYVQHFNLSQSLDQINPLYFETPIAPPLAADVEGRTVDLGVAWRTFEALQRDYDDVLVEGVGGLGTPITHELTVADLARDWQLPTVLVVPVRLGAIGQAIAQVALARQSRVPLRGLVISCTQPDASEYLDQWASIPLLESFTRCPVLGVMPYGKEDSDLAILAQMAAQWDIPQLLPSLASGKLS